MVKLRAHVGFPGSLLGTIWAPVQSTEPSPGGLGVHSVKKRQGQMAGLGALSLNQEGKVCSFRHTAGQHRAP